MASLLDCAKFKYQQRSHQIKILPVVVVYLNNVCDSRCITCSIWKNNDALKMTAERQMADGLLSELYEHLGQWHPRQILISGGEPSLHPRFAEVIRKFANPGRAVSVATNGLLLNAYDPEDLKYVSEFYISFDAPDRESYRQIRGVDGFERLARTMQFLTSLSPRPKIIARCTLQRANVGRLPELVSAAREMRFGAISFLAVDVNTSAFSRNVHGIPHLEAMSPTAEDLLNMHDGIELLRTFEGGFIEGGVGRLQRILQYFRAMLGQAEFPEVRCNAPWASTVIETTGDIRGCFFHPIIGDIRSINGPIALRFRHSLDISTNETCRRCVCSKFISGREFLRM